MTNREAASLLLRINARLTETRHARTDLEEIAFAMRELEAPILPRALVAILRATLATVDYALATLARFIRLEES
jgi:hypothetical protein